jgi:hypothetical protein
VSAVFLEAPSGLKPLNKGFADNVTFAVLLIRFALQFPILPVFARFSAPIVPDLFPRDFVPEMSLLTLKSFNIFVVFFC